MRHAKLEIGDTVRVRMAQVGVFPWMRNEEGDQALTFDATLSHIPSDVGDSWVLTVNGATPLHLNPLSSDLVGIFLVERQGVPF